MQTIIVLDDNKRFLEYVHPAIARKLLKDGKATIFSKEPFVIQINELCTALINTGKICSITELVNQEDKYDRN